MLLENGGPTAADKRLIQDGIEDLVWVAALKPTTIGVLAYRDDEREYLEIGLHTCAGREKRMARRVELNLELQRIEAAQRALKERL